MSRPKSPSLYVEGNNGGSYIILTDLSEEGMVHIEVGDTCVKTVDQRISVAALAQILTQAKDQGLLDKGVEFHGFSPLIDPVVDAKAKGKWPPK